MGYKLLPPLRNPYNKGTNINPYGIWVRNQSHASKNHRAQKPKHLNLSAFPNKWDTPHPETLPVQCPFVGTLKGSSLPLEGSLRPRPDGCNDAGTPGSARSSWHLTVAPKLSPSHCVVNPSMPAASPEQVTVDVVNLSSAQDYGPKDSKGNVLRRFQV